MNHTNNTTNNINVEIKNSQVGIGDNNTFGNQNNNNNNNISIEQLCEKKSKGTVIKFILFDLVGLIANIIAIVTFLYPDFNNENDIVTKLFTLINENMWKVYITIILCATVLIFITAPYFILINKNVANIFYRDKKEVYVVKTLPCPKCGSKTSFAIKDGSGMITCRRNESIPNIV